MTRVFIILLLILGAGGCGSDPAAVDPGTPLPATSFRSADLGLTAELAADVLRRGEDTLLIARRTGYEARAMELLRTGAPLQELLLREGSNQQSLAGHRLAEVQLSGDRRALLRFRPPGVRAAILLDGQPIVTGDPGSRPTTNPSPSPAETHQIEAAINPGSSTQLGGVLTDFNLTFANNLTAVTLYGNAEVVLRLTTPAAAVVGVSESVNDPAGNQRITYTLSTVTLTGANSTGVTYVGQSCVCSQGWTYGNPPPTD